MTQPQILIVEDESIVAMDLKLRLKELGYGVSGLAATGEAAVAMAAELRPDLILMDISLGTGMDGIEAARQVQPLDIPVVFLTAFADEGTLARAKNSAPYGYLLKPFEERTLYSTVEMALYRHRMEQDRLAMETKIQQAQKLESLGVLAGGIAHDFNNLLMGIMGHTGLALMEPNLEPILRRRLHQIEMAATRAADLTNQLLAYSGRGTFQVEPLSLSRLVDEMEGLLETIISKKATLEHHYAPDLPPIEADATQIRQVIMNLITNASDALGDQPGRIIITTGTMATSPLTPCRAGAPPEGEAVFLEVTDTGSGMDADTLARVFDPFFTTKFTGRGLGLAAALGIMRGHLGAVQVESQPGQGTTFRLLFPRSERALPPAEAAEAPDPDYRSHGDILVVDDEETIRSLAHSALEPCGFTIRTAVHGLEGLQIYRAHPTAIRLVVLDLTMPVMNGEEMLTELRRSPGPGASVPVLISSGYSTAEVAANLQRHGTLSFLHKPYRPQDLVQKVRTCLGE
jgi:signal transduction histidine kinase